MNDRTLESLLHLARKQAQMVRDDPRTYAHTFMVVMSQSYNSCSVVGCLNVRPDRTMRLREGMYNRLCALQIPSVDDNDDTAIIRTLCMTHIAIFRCEQQRLLPLNIIERRTCLIGHRFIRKHQGYDSYCLLCCVLSDSMYFDRQTTHSICCECKMLSDRHWIVSITSLARLLHLRELRMMITLYMNEL